MAFKTGAQAKDRATLEAEEVARQAAIREAGCDSKLDATIANVELRHDIHGSWKIMGGDVRTGNSVVVDSTRWPAAERDAFLADPRVRRALVNEDAELRLSLRGKTARTRFGTHYEAQFAKVA